MKKVFFVFLLVCFANINLSVLFAQNNHRCGTSKAVEELYKSRPESSVEAAALNEFKEGLGGNLKRGV